MDGTTRPEFNTARPAGPAAGRSPRRPQDAATLILLEPGRSGVRVLMGRRHERHAFMPGKFVFPGGRTDPDDARVTPSGDLHPEIAARFAAIGKSVARTRAIALSAIRETYEEAGLLIGNRASFGSTSPAWRGFVRHAVAPSLEPLRYIARAITPPGGARRFDAHFFAAWRDSVTLELPDGGPTQELQELVWLTVDGARAADIPAITRSVLGDLADRLAADRRLGPDGPVPFYRMIRNRFCRELL